MTRQLPRELVLALVPSSRGLAYVCFEGPLSPVDWGREATKGKNKNVEGFRAASRLIERLQPDVIVLHEYAIPGVRRSQRVRRLQHLIATYAYAQAIDVRRYSRRDIADVFKKLGAATRYEIAQVIAGHIHAFGYRLPPPRKLWMTEDPRMSLFEAAALALTYFAHRGIVADEFL